ncbi:MAG: hypothetical protein CMJ64_20250 [Planctomycetaceae bacterium]|nr:hypothetical protein [Planctomycetaceae bacterium]
MTEAPRILLVTETAATLERWSGLLGQGDFEVTTQEMLVGSHRVDVILADQSLPAELEQLVRDGTSVIKIGASEPCDLLLEVDATEAEIRLACQLQAKISRLTRESAIGETEREKLADLALTDPLTGLQNRRAWDDQAPKLAAAPGGACLVLIDLDHFKQVNDEHGHAAGDAVLTATGEALRASLRPDDFVVRLGGDEFAFLIPGLRVENAVSVVERVRQSIGSHAEAVGWVITSSVGFVVSTRSVQLASLFEATDQALRDAKTSGRDKAMQGRLGT